VSIAAMSDQFEQDQDQSPEFQQFGNFVKKLVRVPISKVRKFGCRAEAG